MKAFWTMLLYQYKKIQILRNGVYPIFGGQIESEVWIFFILCYQFKDWIKYDKTHDRYRPKVETYVARSIPLKICGDIANTWKHRVLTENPRSGAVPGFTSTVNVTVTGNPAEALIKLVAIRIDTVRGVECGFQLADECMKVWENYLKKNAPDVLE